MLPIQSQIFITEDNEDLILTFSTCPMSSAHPGHSVALRLCVGPKSIRSLACAVLSEIIRCSRSSNVLILEELCTEVGVSV